MQEFWQKFFVKSFLIRSIKRTKVKNKFANVIFFALLCTQKFKTKQVMKQVFIEEIYQDCKLAGVGFVFSSRKKAVAHCKEVAQEQGVQMYEDDCGNFGVLYRANGVRVHISMRESFLQ